MARGQTIRDRFHARPPVGTSELLKIWNEDLTNKLLRIVWEAYDQLHADLLSAIPWDEEYDDLERSLTNELEMAIQNKMDSYLPVQLQHGPSERESRSPAPAQPPEYDMAFVWRADTRITWPLEAKVLKSDAATKTNIKDYVKTLQNRFLKCYYAPFSNGGAMIGYLKQGDPTTLFISLGLGAGISLINYPVFNDRNHRFSDHNRKVPKNKDYPRHFRCHHLILPLDDN